MKAFAKLGLLLTLIIAGRYLRLTDSTTFPKQDRVTARLIRPDTLRFANFFTAQVATAAPASQRTVPVKSQQGEPGYLVWY